MSNEKRLFQEWLNGSSGFFYTINRTLHRGKTRFQDIELVETDEFGNVLLLDNITQVVQKNDWQYHEPIVHVPMLTHSNPEKILIVGGGDGGVLREVLRHPSVTHVDFAELDEEVIEFSRTYLPDINGGAFDDPRVAIHVTDGRKFVESKRGTYDVVIMDMTDPFGPSRMLYTREFFEMVHRSLRSDEGLFAMHSESPITRPVAYQCIRKTLSSAFSTVRTLHTFIQMYATLWSITTSSAASDPIAVSAHEFDRRIADRGIAGLRMIDGQNLLALHVVPPYLDELESADAPVISDEHPEFPDHFTG